MALTLRQVWNCALMAGNARLSLKLYLAWKQFELEIAKNKAKLGQKYVKDCRIDCGGNKGEISSHNQYLYFRAGGVREILLVSPARLSYVHDAKQRKFADRTQFVVAALAAGF